MLWNRAAAGDFSSAAIPSLQHCPHFAGLPDFAGLPHCTGIFDFTSLPLPLFQLSSSNFQLLTSKIDD
ncbi:MAG: hypothetical protein JWL81_679 [Verrucomicrobiales bacterium]|nr:hypothetical protein [Verrucomicrobiales bacterium]